MQQLQLFDTGPYVEELFENALNSGTVDFHPNDVEALVKRTKELKHENNLLCSRLRKAAQLREPMKVHIEMLKSKIRDLERRS